MHKISKKIVLAISALSMTSIAQASPRTSTIATTFTSLKKISNRSFESITDENNIPAPDTSYDFELTVLSGDELNNFREIFSAPSRRLSSYPGYDETLTPYKVGFNHPEEEDTPDELVAIKSILDNYVDEYTYFFISIGDNKFHPWDTPVYSGDDYYGFSRTSYNQPDWDKDIPFEFPFQGYNYGNNVLENRINNLCPTTILGNIQDFYDDVDGSGNRVLEQLGEIYIQDTYGNSVKGEDILSGKVPVYMGFYNNIFYNKQTGNHLGWNQPPIVFEAGVNEYPDINTILDKVTGKQYISCKYSAAIFTAPQLLPDYEGIYDASTPGTYDLLFKTSYEDTYDVNFWLEVIVKDTIAPTIQLLKDLTFNEGETISVSSIDEYISVTDDSNNLENVAYYLDEDEFKTDKTFNSNECGEHTLKVVASDSAGNSTTESYSLIVHDITAPVIKRRDGGTNDLIVGLSRLLNLTEDDFLMLFSATDNHDSSDNLKLQIEGTFIPTTVGEYDITITCTDSANNKGSLISHVIVDSDLPPVFVLSSTLVSASAKQPLSSGEVKTVIMKALQPDKELRTVVVDDTEYQKNATKKGNYPINYSFTYEANGIIKSENDTFTMVVSDNAENAHEEMNGWEKFCNWWVEFWQCFCNWFRGVFTKFKFDCWITDSEWKVRFGE